MIVQNTILTTYFVPIEKFDDWKFPLEDEQKKIFEARSRKQCRVNAELSFEIGSKISLQ